ncbi:MAG: thiamine-phosphate kinase [Pseudomonadota bacterium]|nr:thiamine-phosphate kinase [Pseudomonadota bacterium]
MARSSEFDLIRDCFSTGYPAASDLLLGIGDDCSLITPPSDMELAQSIDTQVAGVHFPADAPPGLIAGRALRCATSDLAAMGAVPQGFHLALTLNNSEDWFLRDLAAGLRLTANTLNMPLLGGDTTYGEHLTITVAVQGWLPRGLGLRRDAARPGQDIWLTGKVGGAALILDDVLRDPTRDDQETAPYYHPRVHLSFGHLLLSLATAAIDISDGLIQDTRHIANASGVVMNLDAEKIPTAVNGEHPRWHECLTGGDDYQLLFTAPANARERIEACALTAGLRECRIVGNVTAGDADVCVHKNNELLVFSKEGYTHFRS